MGSSHVGYDLAELTKTGQLFGHFFLKPPGFDPHLSSGALCFSAQRTTCEATRWRARRWMSEWITSTMWCFCWEVLGRMATRQTPENITWRNGRKYGNPGHPKTICDKPMKKISNGWQTAAQKIKWANEEWTCGTWNPKMTWPPIQTVLIRPNSMILLGQVVFTTGEYN